MEDDIMLSRVVQMDWIAHLGRPLFGSRYDALPKDRSESEIMLFAKQKLLDGKSELADMDGPGTLACLSVRFAPEFNLADGDARSVARRQIERHMRLRCSNYRVRDFGHGRWIGTTSSRGCP
ncbi:hypothetical protein BJV78DRAFT_1236453 [Lactifluus subvellereus]|nr:hypothetical protein BJV78DRAFT_1236453 [Lactifluus subvellereus]